MECPVCLDTKSGNDVKTLGCSHRVCVGCWSRIHTRACPLCRQVHTDARVASPKRKRESSPDTPDSYRKTRARSPSRGIGEGYLEALLEGALYTRGGRQIQISELFP